MQNKQVPLTIAWTAPSHIEHKRSAWWYLVFFLVTVSLITYAIYTRSFLPAITFFLLSAVIIIFNTQQSRQTEYKATKTGIVTGATEIPYKVIKKFWIVYNPPEIKTLNLQTSAYLNNRVIIQLGDQDPVTLKLFLSQYLPEDLEIEESLAEGLARRLKI